MKNIFWIFILVISSIQLNAQFGFGWVFGGDIYQRYVNPKIEGQPESRSSGSALLNMCMGPKLWVGGKKVNVSAEGQINFAPFALDMGDYKGLGAISFPLLVHLNFGSLTTQQSMKKGFSIGGGMQFSQINLYGQPDDIPQNIERKLYRSYVGQVMFGTNFQGANIAMYCRYGVGDNDHSILNIGIVSETNFVRLFKSFKDKKTKNQKKTEHDKEEPTI